MKRVLLTMITLLLFQGLMHSQATRKALVEEVTNASCGPCAAQNPDFNALLHSNPDKVVALKYQWYFPGYDPMYEDNPDEVNVRADYYSINGAPTAAINGVVPNDSYAGGIGSWDIAGGGYAGGPYGFTQGVLDYASSETTPIELHLDHNLSDDFTGITIDVKIKNVSAEEFSLTSGKLHVALIEKELVFPFSPGTNGELDFSDVMKKMYPDQNGTALAAIPAGDSVSFQMTPTLPDYVYDYNELGVVAFVQDDADKVVWQAEISEPKPIIGDFIGVALESSTETPTDLCGATITPRVKVVNNGGLEITSFDVVYSFNGGSPVSQAWTGNLAVGEEVIVDFTETGLESGSTQVEYAVVNINGGASGIELDLLDNIVEPERFSAFSDIATEVDLAYDHEDTDFANPTNTIVDAPIGSAFLVVRRSDLTNQAGDPVGGYGNSQRAIWINFWQWQTPQLPSTGTMTYDKVDLSGYNQALFTFDRAAAGYQGAADQIQVLASTNCGDTWEILYDLSGSDLITGDINSSTFFFPTASQWVTDTVDLSSYAGNADVQIQFKAISNWANNVWLDNINLNGMTVGINDPVNLLEDVKLFPNPTSDVANIEFSLAEETTVDIRVFDLSGKLITVLTENQQFSAGKYIQTWKGAKEAGVYLVKIRTKTGELTKKVTVF